MKASYDSLLALCQSRKSCRSFTTEQITDEAIEQIVTLAETSPYASGRRNWSILVVKEKEVIEALAQAIAEETEYLVRQMDEDIGMAFRKYAENFLLFRQVPVLLIPVFRISPIMKTLLRDNLTPSIEAWEYDNAVKSISCVAILVLLAAESLELGACYMTGPLLAGSKSAEILRLPPGKQIGAIIPIGKPAK